MGHAPSLLPCSLHEPFLHSLCVIFLGFLRSRSFCDIFHPCHVAAPTSSNPACCMLLACPLHEPSMLRLAMRASYRPTARTLHAGFPYVPWSTIQRLDLELRCKNRKYQRCVGRHVKDCRRHFNLMLMIIMKRKTARRFANPHHNIEET